MSLFDWDPDEWESKHMSDELWEVSLDSKVKSSTACSYLRAGRLHLIQGEYDKSLKIFEQGLSTVTSDDPQYPFLTKWKIHAETCIQQRVDIVSQCSYEIFSKIAIHLSQRELETGCGVCSVWRQRILEDPSLWREVSFTRHAFNLPFQIFPLVSHHLERLTVQLSLAKIVSDCLTVLELHDFWSIESLSELESVSLSLIEDLRRSHNLARVTDRAYRALESIGKKLTYLKLHQESGRRSEISLDRVLSNCPNLNVLLCQATHITAPPSGTWLTDATQLTRLELTASEISFSTLESILHRSPQLEELRVRTCSEDITALLEHNCPKLTFLTINSTPQPRLRKLARKSSGNDRLQHMFMTDVPPTKSLFSALKRNASTLETLQLDYLEGNPEDWKPLSALSAPHLKNLSLYLFSEVTRSYAVNICSSHPNIHCLMLELLDDEGIQFQSTENSNTDSLLCAIVNMRNLSELYLDNCHIEGDCFNKLFEHYAVQGQNGPLMRLSMRRRYWEPQNLYQEVCLITKITSLTHLILIGEIYERLSESDIATLVRHMGKMPKLSVLVIHAKKFNMDAAQYIVQYSSLKCIYFEVDTEWSTVSRLSDVIDKESVVLLHNHDIRVAKVTETCTYFEAF